MLFLGLGSLARAATQPAAVATYHKDISPLLEDYCYECHGDGMAKGKVAFDDLTDADLTTRPDLWFNALQNLRADIMPPLGKPRPTPDEEKAIARWIKYSAFGIDPNDPDPGRVTIRRMNRIEYGRTVRSLLGVPYPSEAEFPPDDTGHGFDNIADVLSISPLLLEKYLQAADTIITGVVPQTSRVTPEVTATGRDFRDYDGPQDLDDGADNAGNAERTAMGRPIKYAETATVSHDFDIARDANYSVDFKLAVHGPFNFDIERCRVVASVDGVPCFDEPEGWFDDKVIQFSKDETWKAGKHRVTIAVSPLAKASWPVGIAGKDPREKTTLEVRIISVKVKGPTDPASRILPADYLRFFPKGEPSRFGFLREQYARGILRDFASRAFRRPVDDRTLERLVRLARSVDTAPGGSFEVGISRAMMAVLSSPRFIFRLEQTDPADAGARFPRLDEYSLASRLSYLLWSTMPDARLTELARKGQLRANLHAEVQRMLDDPQSSAFVRNFTGQWLQARDVEFIPINARAVLGLPAERKPGDPRVDFDGETRRAMRSETEMVVSYIIKGDRSVLELVDSNYTFLNAPLAKVYGIDGVSGKQMRFYTLPQGSFRGGVLTDGSVLTVTSNPTRTSPVKRGQFILENILGTPAPPPPPNIPPLEDAKVPGGHDPTLREMLAVHRDNQLCRSCHARMDPLGLAFENFNALGNFREKEAGVPINATGKLITGEEFTDVRGLKKIITHERRTDYYRCITEKLMTYALGRGLEYYDVEAVDRIVMDMEHDGGRFSTLLLGVIDSAPFERRRPVIKASLMALSGSPKMATGNEN